MNYVKIVLLLLSGLFFISCSSSFPLLDPDPDELTEKSPEVYTVIFNTSKGRFDIQVERNKSPLAADRFYFLTKNNYYNNNRFFRVLPNFVVQWGMKGIPAVDELWGKMGIKDEPVKMSNLKGTLSFARSGPNTRSNQLFINLADNERLDASDFNNVIGFPAFGKVIKGMEIVEAINSDYLQKPDQDSIRIKGNSYLNKNFPELDYIINTEIVE